MADWTIIDATPEDLDRVSDFAERVWTEYHRDQRHGRAYDWHSQPVELIACDEGGSVVGLARGDISAGVGHLSELLVATELRRTGLGSELLSTFEARCWSAGCHKLTLHTEHDGLAWPFYERRDWQLEAVHRRDKAGLDFARLVKFRDNSSARDG